MKSYDVEVESRVRVVVNDESAITRCVENHDDEGVPQPDVQGGTGFRNMHYDIDDEEGVINHFAYNCVRNGVEDASRLDGWADLERGAVTMQLVDVTPEHITDLEPR